MSNIFMKNVCPKKSWLYAHILCFISLSAIIPPIFVFWIVFVIIIKYKNTADSWEGSTQPVVSWTWQAELRVKKRRYKPLAPHLLPVSPQSLFEVQISNNRVRMKRSRTATLSHINFRQWHGVCQRNSRPAWHTFDAVDEFLFGGEKALL